MESPPLARNFRAYLVFFLYIIFEIKTLAHPIPMDFNGFLSRWDRSVENPTVYYDVFVDEEIFKEYFMTLIENSSYLWSHTPKSFLTLKKSTKGKAHISFHITKSLPGANFSSGFATFDKFDKHLKPTHCTIHIMDRWELSTYSLSKTILHELGHCLGLGHSLIPESIMSYHMEKNQFALSVDDQAALSRLYPADGSNPKLPPGCASGTTHNKKNSFTTLMMLLLPFMLAFLSGLKKKREELG